MKVIQRKKKKKNILLKIFNNKSILKIIKLFNNLSE